MPLEETSDQDDAEMKAYRADWLRRYSTARTGSKKPRRRRPKPWLDRCNATTGHVVAWLIGSPDFDSAAVVEQAHQEEIKEHGKRSPETFDGLTDDFETFCWSLGKTIRNWVNQQLGDYRDAGPHAEFLEPGDSGHHAVDRLIGGLVQSGMCDVDFEIVAEAILAHKHQAAARGT